MEVTVNIVDRATCQKSYNTITSRMICAGVPDGGKDSCQVQYRLNYLQLFFDDFFNIYVLFSRVILGVLWSETTIMFKLEWSPLASVVPGKVILESMQTFQT